MQIPNNSIRARHLIVIFFWLMAIGNSVSYGQDISFTQFYINPALLNPSFTGSEGRPVLFLSYRKQWVGIDGSPTIMNMGLQTSLPNKLNLGVNFNNQKVGLQSSSSAMFSAGYTLPLAQNNFL